MIQYETQYLSTDYIMAVKYVIQYKHFFTAANSQLSAIIKQVMYVEA